MTVAGFLFVGQFWHIWDSVKHHRALVQISQSTWPWSNGSECCPHRGSLFSYGSQHRPPADTNIHTHTHTPSWSRRSCPPLFRGTSWCLWSGMTWQSVWGWIPFLLRKDYWGVVSLFHLLNSLRWLWET